MTENGLMFWNNPLCDRTILKRSSTSTDSLQTPEKDRKTRMSIKIILSKPPTCRLSSHPKFNKFPRASHWL